MKEGPVVIDYNRLLFGGLDKCIYDGRGHMAVLGFVICHVLGKSSFSKTDARFNHPNNWSKLRAKRKNDFLSKLIKHRIVMSQPDGFLRAYDEIWNLHDRTFGNYLQLNNLQYFATQMCGWVGLECKFINFPDDYNHLVV